MLDIIGKEIKTLSVNISQRCLVSSLWQEAGLIMLVTLGQYWQS